MCFPYRKERDLTVAKNEIYINPRCRRTHRSGSFVTGISSPSIVIRTNSAPIRAGLPPASLAWERTLAIIIVTCYDNPMTETRRRPGRPPTGQAQTAAERVRRYRARQRAAGLRPSTRWQPVASPPMSPGMLKHRVIEARSLAMHCLIAQKIGRDPRLLDVARRNLAAWSARYGDQLPRALDEWRVILTRPWHEIAALITDAGETATRLRQSSPFAGVLTPTERRRVYEAFRA